MSTGQGNIAFTPKKEPVPAPGPPFAPTSADNGLEVDGGTGQIFLGGNQLVKNTQVSTGAFLLDFQEANTNGFHIDPAQNQAIMGFKGATPTINVENGANELIAINTSTQQIELDVTNDRSQMGAITGIGTTVIADNANSEIELRATNGVKTSAPAGGAGNWKLGTVQAAAVALDATQFVEIEINGVQVRLAIVV